MLWATSDLDLAYRTLLENLLGLPPGPAPRGQATREMINGQFWFDGSRPALNMPARDLNYRFMVAEFVWILFGLDDLAVLTQYNSKMAQFSDDGLTLAGAYGTRVARYLPYVVRTLLADRDSRQAVIPVFDDKATRPSKDVPCTLDLAFYVRHEIVHVAAFMRSSDVWLGVPYDAFTFAMLGHVVAAAIRAKGVGTVCITAGSQHTYDANRDAILKALETSRGVQTAAYRAVPNGAPLWLPAHASGRLELPWAMVDILTKPAIAEVDAVPPSWRALARCLAAKTSAEARGVLASLG